MYLVENPVLQRELLVNLRTTRAFVLLLVYQMILAALVYFAWPQDQRLDLTSNPVPARNLVDLFFFGQYLLASLMAPSFAAGAITGEKERLTYEMLLASPLRPGAIVIGKLVASLAHLAVLIFSSLPIVMLCLPLGGVSLYELLAAYLGLMVSVVTFGAISIACSSYFKRTSASLVVSYLLILPLAMTGILSWYWLTDSGPFRLLLTVTLVPGVGLALCATLLANTSARLLRPPDVGSEGNEVVDLEQEAKEAVGLVIQTNQFPDMLFVSAKRETLMPDGTNPVLDKELRSEIFSQGTLMLRVVIQVSMFLAIPLMAVCLYIAPRYAAWYVAYVLLFNVLVGPVFLAGSVTSERERQTLDLLLTTAITPWQILWGKLLAGLRVSSVLTGFLLWPILLASVMVSSYWTNLPAIAGYLGIVLLSCITT
ncbi:MAG: ABC transporter permease subunit, partial [Pirellulaceae bacterium]|nr:ABC transporter permease subunit [Pirellulaceae bacterium]